jgi:hypothetical protein
MASRRNRRGNRKSRRSTRRQRGGVAPLNYSMGEMTQQSLAQGNQFAEMHKAQHGGAAGFEGGPYPGSVGGDGMLPSGLVASSRVGPLNTAISEIQGMKDQGGGRRRHRHKSHRRRHHGRRHRKTHRGGSYKMDTAAPYGSPSMLLPSSLEAKALTGMNAEWRLAANPGSFAPGR